MDENEKTKSKKWLIIAIITVLVIVAIVIAIAFFNKTKEIKKNPKEIFNKNIDAMINVFNFKEFDTEKVKLGIELEIEAVDSEEQATNNTSSGVVNASSQIQEINNILKDCKLDIGTQIDIKNKKEIVDISLDYQGENAISLQEYYSKGKTYIYLDKIFNKYIEMDSDTQMFNEIFEKGSDIKIKDNKASVIVADEIKSALSNQNFTTESEDIELNNKKVKTTKNILNLDAANFQEIIETICENLENNEEFLNCFNESPKQALKELAKDISGDATGKIIIAIYTKGNSDEFIGVKFEFYNKEEKEAELKIIKEDTSAYAFELGYYDIKSSGLKMANTKTETEYDYKTIKGNIKISEKANEDDYESGTIDLSIELEGIKLKAAIDYEIERNEEIDKPKANKSIKLNKITEEEQEEIVKKLTERPLIGELINAYLMQNTLFERAQEGANQTRIEAEKEQLVEYIYGQYKKNADGKAEVNLEKVKDLVENDEQYESSQIRNDTLVVTGKSGKVYNINKSGEIN